MAQFTDNQSFSFNHSNIVGVQAMKLNGEENEITLITFINDTKLGIPGNHVELFNTTRKNHAEK